MDSHFSITTKHDASWDSIVGRKNFRFLAEFTRKRLTTVQHKLLSCCTFEWQGCTISDHRSWHYLESWLNSIQQASLRCQNSRVWHWRLYPFSLRHRIFSQLYSRSNLKIWLCIQKHLYQPRRPSIQNKSHWLHRLQKWWEKNYTKERRQTSQEWIGHRLVHKKSVSDN